MVSVLEFRRNIPLQQLRKLDYFHLPKAEMFPEHLPAMLPDEAILINSGHERVRMFIECLVRTFSQELREC